MSVGLSVEAEEDIIAIAEQGVRMFGAGQAKRYHDELFALLGLLAANPRIARERDEINPPVRIHPFKAHLVVYRIEDDETISVIRVRHEHEDWASN
ncbi:type II toxin-antitoxin system RelE/ParE family toxin [Ciceribacter thiooxidans]|uniref:Toxin n=1 Tax=Ciceribacter thiooxidans TaxID=1969821 RepID=A0ABV7IB57_9HYPH|nr:type II toxin-antitoxin system RelE/ParE family toxin [Ciceribacter thiooxidans]